MPSRTLLNVILRNPTHVHVRVFSGDNTLAKNGDLVFTPEEWHSFNECLRYGLARKDFAIQINDDTLPEVNDLT